jgi:hypothetical protein
LAKDIDREKNKTAGGRLQPLVTTGQQLPFGLILQVTKESGPIPLLARLPNKNNNRVTGLHQPMHPHLSAKKPETTDASG